MAVSVAEFISKKADSLSVRKGEEFALTAVPRGFVHTDVLVATTDDVVKFGLLPDGVSIDALEKSILQDDERCLDTVFSSHSDTCLHCSGSGSPLRTRGHSVLYSQMRRRRNPALAQALSEALSVRVAWDDPMAEFLRRVQRSIRNGRRLRLRAAKVGKLSVEAGARVSVDSTAVNCIVADEVSVAPGGMIKVGTNAPGRLLVICGRLGPGENFFSDGCD